MVSFIEYITTGHQHTKSSNLCSYITQSVGNRIAHAVNTMQYAGKILHLHQKLSFRHTPIGIIELWVIYLY